MTLGILATLSAVAQNRLAGPLSQSSGSPQAISGNRVLDPASDAAGGPAASSAHYTFKPGYAGQLFDVAALAVNSALPSVNEGASNQMTAVAMMDDGTRSRIPPLEVGWTLLSGPVSSITPGGIAQTVPVFSNRQARIGGTWFGTSDDAIWTVVNSDRDNVSPVNGDGIDDAWQFGYFDTAPRNGMLDAGEAARATPGADPDKDGRNNVYEFLSGYAPDDGNSYLIFRVIGVDTNVAHLVFSKVIPTTRYTVIGTPALSTPPSWTNLGLAFSGVGATNYPVDHIGVLTAQHFYRVGLEPAP